MNDLRYNLSSSACRVDRYISKALLGAIVGGLTGAASSVLLAVLHFSLLWDLPRAEWLPTFAPAVPQIIYGGMLAGGFIGAVVALIATWYGERKLGV